MMAATPGNSAATFTVTSPNAVVMPGGGIYVYGAGTIVMPPAVSPPATAPLAQVIDARGRFEQRARLARGDA